MQQPFADLKAASGMGIQRQPAVDAHQRFERIGGVERQLQADQRPQRMADHTVAGDADRGQRLCQLTGHLRQGVLFRQGVRVIADETDEAARAKWERYKDGADDEALSWLTEQSQKDTRSGADTNVRQMADPTSAVNINMGTLVGSYASVARMLDEVAAVPGAEGVLLTFDDFLTGVETFGERIQPLMQCRAHIPAITKEVA